MYNKITLYYTMEYYEKSYYTSFWSCYYAS